MYYTHIHTSFFVLVTFPRHSYDYSRIPFAVPDAKYASFGINFSFFWEMG